MYNFCILLDEVLIREQNFTLHNVVDLTADVIHQALEEIFKIPQCNWNLRFPLDGNEKHYLHNHNDSPNADSHCLIKAKKRVSSVGVLENKKI